MVRIGRILAVVILMCSVLISGCSQEGEREASFADPFEELVEILKLTEDQVQQLETGTGTLQLNQEQIDTVREPVEELAEVLEELLDEARWQEVEGILTRLLTNGEGDLQDLYGIAADMQEIWEPVPNIEVVTRLEKLEGDVCSLEENRILSADPWEVTTIYTPGGTPEDIDEGQEDIEYKAADTVTLVPEESVAEANVNLETGKLFVWSQSWVGASKAFALIGIPIHIRTDNTGVVIETTLRYVASSTSGGIGLTASSIATRFQNLFDYGGSPRWDPEYKVIDPIVGLDEAATVICGAIGPFLPPLGGVCVLTEGLGYTLDLLSFVELRQAMLDMDITEEVITYNVGRLDSGSYCFYIGLSAGTSGAVVGLPTSCAVGQVSKIEVTEYIPSFELSVLSRLGGEVKSPGEGVFEYTAGDSVPLLAEAYDGYRFVNWEGGVDTVADVNSASTTIVMDHDYGITANFEKIPLMQYYLSTATNGHGSVDSPGEGSWLFDAGSVVPLVASPDDGYRFVEWIGNNVDTIANVYDASTTIAMEGDYYITAIFEQEGEEPVYFPDTNLEAAIREAIGKPTGDIYASDLDGLTYLDASQRNIADLTGLEYATDLVWLDLSENWVSDISCLTDLTNLTELYIWGNQISDVSALASLTSLAVLWLGVNQVSDVSDLSNLSSLTQLYIWDNQITDISPLMGLTNLTELHLRGNDISNIGPLSDLTKVTLLNLWGNQVVDISPLENLSSLTDLELRYNEIEDISPLAGLTGLTRLSVGGNRITDVSPLSDLTGLTELYVDENWRVSDWWPLASLTGLTKLYLWASSITDISFLAGLTNLTLLQLNNNDVTDLSPLVNLTDLTQLCLRGNEISDVSPLLENSGLGAGDRVWVEWNPLSNDSINIYIPELEARGVTVYYDS